jgi:hypothetical protein
MMQAMQDPAEDRLSASADEEVRADGALHELVVSPMPGRGRRISKRG